MEEKKTPTKRKKTTGATKAAGVQKPVKKKSPGAGAKRTRKTKKASSAKKWWKSAVAIVVILAGVIFGGWKIWNSDAVQMRFVYMWDYQQDIITYSEKNKIDPFLVAAIIKNESDFNPKAVSKVGAVGLMQIMPDTGRWIAEQMGLKPYEDADLYKTQTNIRMGCWYVSELDHEFKHNLTLVMIAYNAGRGKTHEWMEKHGWTYDFNTPQTIPYPDTREYVIKVLHDRDRYYQLYKEKLQK